MLWAIAKLSDAQIERMAARDADNPATKKADWAKAFIGAPPLKTPVNAKFDVDVVEWFRSQSRSYQARITPSSAATWALTARWVSCPGTSVRPGAAQFA